MGRTRKTKNGNSMPMCPLFQPAAILAKSHITSLNNKRCHHYTAEISTMVSMCKRPLVKNVGLKTLLIFTTCINLLQLKTANKLKLVDLYIVFGNCTWLWFNARSCSHKYPSPKTFLKTKKGAYIYIYMHRHLQYAGTLICDKHSQNCHTFFPQRAKPIIKQGTISKGNREKVDFWDLVIYSFQKISEGFPINLKWGQSRPLAYEP